MGLKVCKLEKRDLIEACANKILAPLHHKAIH